jgi:ABC-type transport system involved in multi-copper enzyme maturation permease subunit
MPKVMAVASATSKEAVSQPLFQIVVAVGAFALVAFIFIPYNTFGEDVKMLKMGALEWIMALAILVAAWTASVSISEELEGRTALTVLSKPIGRIQFILGKFLGVMQAVSLLYIFLGAVFLICVSGKVVYDVRESVLPEALWTDCFDEMMDIVPGLILGFFETMVITSISVAIATRLPMLPNLLISFSIYALGNLAPMLVQANVNDPFGIVRFVGHFFATVLPVLENFNIQAAISAGLTVPITYLLWAMLYSFLYSTIAMLLALALFEDRDLA